MIKIREVKSSDQQALQKIVQEELKYEVSSETLQSQLTRILKDSRNQIFVAEAENKVVGYVQLESYETLYFAPLINIMGLAVLSDYQHKGIGKALMEYAENWGKKNGFHGVRVNSGNDRKEAHKFYQKIGYTLRKLQANFIKIL